MHNSKSAEERKKFADECKAEMQLMAVKNTCGVCKRERRLEKFHIPEAQLRLLFKSRDPTGADMSPWPFKDCGLVCKSCYRSKKFNCMVCLQEKSVEDLAKPPHTSPCYRHAEVICKRKIWRTKFSGT